ncbi:MAG TPA: flagellin [Stellaceae bacterium]|jgi:flagellar hook-associated protein 3 FlgL|nr:flagellin [Stellaceae bacterium]
MTRVGTLAENNQILQYLQQSKSTADSLQLQITTGLKSTNFSGIAPQSAQLVNLSDQQAKQQGYIDTINTVSTRLQVMGLSIGSIETLATQFVGNLPTDAYNTQGETIQEQAKQVLGQVAGYLNTQDGANYVFSGNNTSSPPVDTDGLPNPGSLTAASDGAPPNGYYEGDDGIAQATVDNNVTLSYGVNANNPAFEQFIRVLNFLANAPAFDQSNATDVANVNRATQMLNSVVTQLQTLQGTNALQQGQLSNQLDNHKSALALAQGSIADIAKVDPATAITQLDTLQTQLQASYQIIGILQQLSLVNYMK